MPSVRIRDTEAFDISLKRFRRMCNKEGLISEIRRREFYEKPTALRRRKAIAAQRRHQKKLRLENPQLRRKY